MGPRGCVRADPERESEDRDESEARGFQQLAQRVTEILYHGQESIVMSGERTRLACWRWRLAIANFSGSLEKRAFRRGAETNTRGACAPQTKSLPILVFTIMSHGTFFTPSEALPLD